MIKNKLYLIGGIALLIVVVIATILITKALIGGDKEYIQELERQTQEAKVKEYRAKRALDSLSSIGDKETPISDSLKKVIKEKDRNYAELEAQLKTIKGKYKKYSNDSLYKEIMKVYENSIDNASDIPTIRN